jgi:transposase
MGKVGRVKRAVKKSTRWSVLPALTLDQGYVKPILVEGGVTSQIFYDWLTLSLLPALHIRPRYHDIIIMDNCAIHKNPAVIEAIEAAGAECHFLPPYCPEFNPIEQTFNVLKRWIRREYKNQREAFESYEEFLKYAVIACGQGEHAIQNVKGHFEESGYRNFDEEEE